MRVIKSLLALSCSISLTGQAFAAGLGKGEGEVDIVAWPGYIERGESDKNYDWVTDFEKNTGCKVNVKTAGTSDEMVALMNEGGFDLVTASGDASLPASASRRSIRRESQVGRPWTSACRPRPGIRSTASTSASLINGGRMSS